jgi:hypothetical protein
LAVNFDGAAGVGAGGGGVTGGGVTGGGVVLGAVTVNVTTVKTVECVQVGENWSWDAPTAALLGTVKGSVKAPALLMDAVPSVWPQPLTLIDEHPDQSAAEAVTLAPGGPCAGDSVGGLSAALARSAKPAIRDSGTARIATNVRMRRSIMTPQDPYRRDKDRFPPQRSSQLKAAVKGICQGE